MPTALLGAWRMPIWRVLVPPRIRGRRLLRLARTIASTSTRADAAAAGRHAAALRSGSGRAGGVPQPMLGPGPLRRGSLRVPPVPAGPRLLRGRVRAGLRRARPLRARGVRVRRGVVRTAVRAGAVPGPLRRSFQRTLPRARVGRRALPLRARLDRGRLPPVDVRGRLLRPRPLRRRPVRVRRRHPEWPLTPPTTLDPRTRPSRCACDEGWRGARCDLDSCPGHVSLLGAPAGISNLKSVDPALLASARVGLAAAPAVAPAPAPNASAAAAAVAAVAAVRGWRGAIAEAAAAVAPTDAELAARVRSAAAALDG